MKKLDHFESELLDAFEQGKLKSISPSKADFTKFKAAATATFLKEALIYSTVRPELVEGCY